MSVDKTKLPTLRPGSRGAAVKAAKMGINVWNAKKGNTTSVYGPFLVPLVKAFKRDQRVGDTTGVIGPPTWEALLRFIPKEGKALLPQLPLIPDLGPVVKGGQSVLDHDCTHATGGIPLYPAFDDAFAQGLTIIAPEPLTVTRQSSSRPGHAFYATGSSGIRYWFGHLDALPAVGMKFAKGTRIGRTCANPIGGGPHVHVGVNVETLWGKGRELAHHTNYTHGAPTIRAQLAAQSST